MMNTEYVETFLINLGQIRMLLKNSITLYKILNNNSVNK